jgi:hypothetical protein
MRSVGPPLEEEESYYYYYRPSPAAFMPPVSDTISVHTVLVVNGYAGCLLSAGFCVLLVCLSPGPVNEKGGLHYVSEAFFAHCGFANVVMGTCSLLLLACQLVAAAHMVHHTAMGCALAQAVGWNVVLGVVDTGWTVHYVGLLVFLVGNLGYHYIASRDPAYGSPSYVIINGLACFFSLVFCALAGASIFEGEDNVVVRSFAVSVEFVVVLALVVQNLWLVRALDQFRDIRLRFETY